MLRVQGPGQDQGRDPFGMAGVQTEAVGGGTPRWHLQKTDFDVYMPIYMHNTG